MNTELLVDFTNNIEALLEKQVKNYLDLEAEKKYYSNKSEILNSILLLQQLKNQDLVGQASTATNVSNILTSLKQIHDDNVDKFAQVISNQQSLITLCTQLANDIAVIKSNTANMNRTLGTLNTTDDNPKNDIPIIEKH